MARETAVGMFCRNLPRPGRLHASSGADPSHDQYPRPMAGQYEGPDCPGTIAGDSLRVPPAGIVRGPVGTTGAHRHMTHPLIHRVWRLCVTLGPIIAIALTLAAGRRWY